MPGRIFPYIPKTITVHLGAAEEDAENVTVSFSDYIKNVVSSEIYPTWEQAALQANTLAILSYALNRVYTEYYVSRGYAFQITAVTATDQRFVYGRNIFENISQVVDDLYGDYLRRVTFVEPLAAKFCNGITTQCEGLSQWGSQTLAQQGESAQTILETYYGNDIELVTDAPTLDISESYPGTPIRQGDIGVYVAWIQVSLNRVSQSYPAIPKLLVDGIFGEDTLEAVKTFQELFFLTVDGIVGRATWYRLVLLYDALQKLSELQSEGQRYYGFAWEYPTTLSYGQRGVKITHLQYMLTMVSSFLSGIPAPGITGTYDNATRESVLAFQESEGLPATGTVDLETWDVLYAQFSGLENEVLSDRNLFPFSQSMQSATDSVSVMAEAFSAFLPDFDEAAPVSSFQKATGLPVTGKLDEATVRDLSAASASLGYSKTPRFFQYPGVRMTNGMQDERRGVL